MNYYDNLIILKLKTVTCEINDDILSWFIILERINKNLITVFEKKSKTTIRGFNIQNIV